MKKPTQQIFLCWGPENPSVFKAKCPCFPMVSLTSCSIQKIFSKAFTGGLLVKLGSSCPEGEKYGCSSKVKRFPLKFFASLVPLFWSPDSHTGNICTVLIITPGAGLLHNIRSIHEEICLHRVYMFCFFYSAAFLYSVFSFPIMSSGSNSSQQLDLLSQLVNT